MEINLETLRKSKNQDYSKLTEKIEEASNPNRRTADERFWKPEKDKTGNGAALIRFLSVPGSDELPFVTVESYYFQGPTNKYYVENSLRTIGLPDPVWELNGEDYGSNDPEREAAARKRSRQIAHIANILVIDDKTNPENNGKVFLYKFGKKIMDKIISAQKPAFTNEEPIKVWDAYEGSNFKLILKTISENNNEWNNYDDSQFLSKPEPLAGGDEEKMLEILKSQYDLFEFKDPAKFKSYDDLKAKLTEVMGGSSSEGHEHDSPSEPVKDEKPIESAKAPEPKSSNTKDAFDSFDDDIPF